MTQVGRPVRRSVAAPAGIAVVAAPRSSHLHWGMPVIAFHPILYVEDPYAERDFFARFGFVTTFEGPEFPGFLAIECGSVRFGLSRGRGPMSETNHHGVRWQLLVDDVDGIASVCAADGLRCELLVEEGGDSHRARIAKVLSPNGVTVWFEGPNERG